MADILTKKSLVLLKVGAVLPTASDFVETSEALIPNPKPVTISKKRLTGGLGFEETGVDTANVTFEGISLVHGIRETGSDFTIQPEFANLLLVSGFEENFDATPANEFYEYTNTQTPTRGSMILHTDGKKQEFTDTVVGDVTITATIGEFLTMDVALSAFYDNSGIPTSVANPAVTESTETSIMVSQGDLIVVDAGTPLEAKSVVIKLTPDIVKTYAMTRKDFQITDYICTIEVVTILDSADYITTISDLQAQTTRTLDLKLGTKNTGALINGESMHITAPLAKVTDFTDNNVDDRIERTIVYTLTPDGSNEALKIKSGFFA